MVYRFDNRNICIFARFKIKIFADNADTNLFFYFFDFVRKGGPVSEILVAGRQTYGLKQRRSEVFFFKINGNVVNGIYIRR